MQVSRAVVVPDLSIAMLLAATMLFLIRWPLQPLLENGIPFVKNHDKRVLGVQEKLVGFGEWLRTLPESPKTTRKSQTLELKGNTLYRTVPGPWLVEWQVRLLLPSTAESQSCMQQTTWLKAALHA